RPRVIVLGHLFSMRRRRSEKAMIALSPTTPSSFILLPIDGLAGGAGNSAIDKPAAGSGGGTNPLPAAATGGGGGGKIFSGAGSAGGCATSAALLTTAPPNRGKGRGPGDGWEGTGFSGLTQPSPGGRGNGASSRLLTPSA